MFNMAKCYYQDDGFGASFEDLVDLFLKGMYWYGPWWDHIEAYCSMQNIHFIHYESLLKVNF